MELLPLLYLPIILSNYVFAARRHYSSGDTINITDSAFSKQAWFLGENGMNVTGAWQHCMTGTGVRIAFIDDPICPTHRELSDAYVGSLDDRPCFTRRSSNHGTMTAGLAVNSPAGRCGVGVAFGAQFDMHSLSLDIDLADYMEAEPLKKNVNSTDIFSSRWSISQMAVTWAAVGRDVLSALNHGITQGRNGKGAIYVWAGGNGGLNDNSCAYDGFINSRFTIAVAGVDKRGSKLRTGEACSAIFASAYSQHVGDRSGIITSAWRDGCAEDFSDSSAAAPLATGAIALMLQANPALTWRDVQHIIVRTADRDKLNARWTTNGAGYRVSPTFGFGLLNAGKMVEMARQWGSVPEQQHCVIRSSRSRQLQVFIQEWISIPTSYDRCLNNMAALEHVEVYINATYNARGHLKVALLHDTMEVNLLPGRYQDAYSSTIDWTVMAVAFWGVDPRRGHWRLRLKRAFTNLQSQGILHGWSVHYYGIASDERRWGEKAALNTPLPWCLMSTSTELPTESTVAPVYECIYVPSGAESVLTSAFASFTVFSMDVCKTYCSAMPMRCRSLTHVASSNQCHLNGIWAMEDTVKHRASGAVTYDRKCGYGISASEGVHRYTTAAPMPGSTEPLATVRPTNPFRYTMPPTPPPECSYRLSSITSILDSQYASFWVSSINACMSYCNAQSTVCKSFSFMEENHEPDEWYQCHLNSRRVDEDTVQRIDVAAKNYDRICPRDTEVDSPTDHASTRRGLTWNDTVEHGTSVTRRVIGEIITAVTTDIPHTGYETTQIANTAAATAAAAEGSSITEIPQTGSQTDTRAIRTPIHPQRTASSLSVSATQALHLPGVATTSSTIETPASTTTAGFSPATSTTRTLQNLNDQPIHVDTAPVQATTPRYKASKSRVETLTRCSSQYTRKAKFQVRAVHPSLAESLTSVPSFRACRQHCTDMRSGICLSFGYHRSSRRCMLYRVPLDQLRLSNKGPVATKMRLFQRNCAYSPLGEAFVLIARGTRPSESWNSRISGMSLSACLISCHSDVRCKSVTYQQPLRYCYIYGSSRAVGDLSDHESTVSYRKAESSS